MALFQKLKKRKQPLLRTYTEEAPADSFISVKTAPDGTFLVLAMLLQAIGIIMCFSASSAYAESSGGSSFNFLLGQLKFLAIGIAVVVFLLIFATPKRVRIIAILTYGVALLLLVAVLIIGTAEGVAKRWILIGGISIQPSEIAKTGLILILSLYMSRYEEEINVGKFNKKKLIHGFIIPGIFVAVVLGLVALEKHISGLIIICVISAVMMFLGGTSFPLLAGLGAAAAAAVWVLINFTGYSSARIDSWLHRGADVLGNDWQSTQGLYAIGTGGLFGLGIGQSRLKYGYVSQPQNDFVFTVVCEELGFFGALTILLLFLALIGRGFSLAAHAGDKFSSLAIFGLTFKLAVHVLFNVAVVTGLFPNTGISLPFFSSGGSATIMQLVDIGLILALSRYSTQKR